MSNAPCMSPRAPISIHVGMEAKEKGLASAGASWTRLIPNPNPSPCNGCRRRSRRYQQILLVPDEIGLTVDGELVVLAHENRAHGTRLLAVPAEDAAHLVNL